MGGGLAGRGRAPSHRQSLSCGAQRIPLPRAAQVSESLGEGRKPKAHSHALSQNVLHGRVPGQGEGRGHQLGHPAGGSPRRRQHGASLCSVHGLQRGEVVKGGCTHGWNASAVHHHYQQMCDAGQCHPCGCAILVTVQCQDPPAAAYHARLAQHVLARLQRRDRLLRGLRGRAGGVA